MFHVEHVPRGTIYKGMNLSGKHYGKLVDVLNQDIYPAEITVKEGKIISIQRSKTETDSFLLPGLIDSHVHIESSMLTPQNFGRIALSHGTVATVSDPHEIANVLGIEGVKYMIENASGSDLKFFFGAPSCVPATKFESSGAALSPEEIESLFKNQNLLFLSEMMN
jgi:adenine deaminase